MPKYVGRKFFFLLSCHEGSVMKLRRALGMFCMSMAFGSVSALAQVAYVLPELLPPPEQKNTAKQPTADEPLMIPVPAVRLTLGLVDVPTLRGAPLERPQALTVLRNRLGDEVAPPATPVAPVEPAANATASANTGAAAGTPVPEAADGAKEAPKDAVKDAPKDAVNGAPAETPKEPAKEPVKEPAKDAPGAVQPGLEAPTVSPQRSEHLSALEESTSFGAPAWITEVAMPHPGVHHFIMETKPTWTPSANRFVQHVAKALQPSQDNMELWDKSSGLDFEILPLSRPFNLCAGMSFSGQVVRNGQPVPHATIETVWLPDVAVGRKKNTKPLQTVEQIIRTDAEGIFTVTCPWAGWWGFSAVTSGGDPLKDPDGNLKPVDLKTTLWVPMGSCTPGGAS